MKNKKIQFILLIVVLFLISIACVLLNYLAAAFALYGIGIIVSEFCAVRIGISIQVGETNTNYLETSKRYAIWEETSTMPTISKITLPNGNTYDIKDTWAREQISEITGGSAIVFKGVSSTELTDGGNQNPTVDGTAVTTKVVGDLYF